MSSSLTNAATSSAAIRRVRRHRNAASFRRLYGSSIRASGSASSWTRLRNASSFRFPSPPSATPFVTSASVSVSVSRRFHSRSSSGLPTRTNAAEPEAVPSSGAVFGSPSLETRSRRPRRGRAVDGRDPRSAPTPLAPRNAPRAVRSGGSAAGASEERASRVARRVEFRLQRASRCEFAHQSTARVRRRPRARCRARARPRDRRAARATPPRPPPRRRTRRRTRSPRDASSARPARASSCTRTFEG